MSYKPEVQTDSTGKWYDNALRFATEQEAFDSARDLACCWSAVLAYRATECNDQVNYTYHDHKLVEAAKETTNEH
jgi:hypothetical protein